MTFGSPLCQNISSGHRKLSKQLCLSEADKRKLLSDFCCLSGRLATGHVLAGQNSGATSADLLVV